MAAPAAAAAATHVLTWPALHPAHPPAPRFREALEAAVVVSVLLQLVEKMRMPQLKKHGAPLVEGRRRGVAAAHARARRMQRGHCAP